MPIVEVVEIINRNVESIWKIASNTESYPKFMKPITSVKIVGREGASNLVEWEAILNGSILRWTETELLFPAQHRIEFCQSEGDFERFSGYWQLKAISPTTTEAILHIDFEIGVASLREMLDPVAEQAILENSKIMVRSLESGDDLHGS